MGKKHTQERLCLAAFIRPDKLGQSRIAKFP